jgi:hypothetical protein
MAAITARPDVGPASRVRAEAERARKGLGFRYGAVLLLAMVLVVFLIAAPAGDWSRAVALALEFLALTVVILTSKEREQVRTRRALALGVVGVAFVVAIGLGAMPQAVTSAAGALLALLIPASLLGGLIKLVRRKGVTLQVVAGALAIYLMVGVIFAFVIGFAAKVGAHPYFAQGGDGTSSERVYFSFATLTTTGYGDFTAGQSFGRSLSVVEMLTGQLYLVTVIGVLVGDIASRRRGAADLDES